MGWTDIPLWLVGQIVTAAEMNTYHKDNTDYLKALADSHKIQHEPTGSDEVNDIDISNTGTLLSAHKTRHQNGGADKISVAGLSGLLADDQHVLDAEVLAVAVNKAGDTMTGDLHLYDGAIPRGLYLIADKMLYVSGDEVWFTGPTYAPAKWVWRNAAGEQFKISNAGVLEVGTIPNARLSSPIAATSGTYTGDSSVNRAIAHGLGRIPKMVFIIGGAAGWYRIITGQALIWYQRASLSESGNIAVTAPDATNFYVGNATNYANSANLATGDYYWIAIG